MKPILLFVTLLLWGCLIAGCGTGAAPGKPDLPASISPGWALKGYEGSAEPAGLPEGARPQCWKALYSGAQDASAEVWVCGYRESGSAFNAMQRAPVSANTVKWQKGPYLEVVHWSGGSRGDVTALMRGLQKALGN